MTGRPRWRAGWPLRSGAVALIGLLVITLLAVIGPSFAPANPLLRVDVPYLDPSWHHWLGTDEVGRDLLSRILYGIRLTWFPVLAVIALATAVGTAVGTVSATAGGLVELMLNRLSDLMMVIPSTLIALAAAAALGPGIWHLVAAISVFWWPWYARIAHTDIRRVATRAHVEAARLAGVKNPRLMLRYLLPAALPSLLVAASLDVANVILVLAMFSFLGLGAPAPAPELGAMTARSLVSLTTHWWIPLTPAIVIFVLAFTANLAGDGIRRWMEST
jgi:peptide/nickel transport system permease protein